MPAARLHLESLLEQAEALDAEAFVAAHPGFFLVAMGRLSAEDIRARVGVDEDATARVRLGSAHDLTGTHPLAGQAFHFVEPLKERLRVGRGAGCDIQVPDESVSDLHCELEVGREGLLVLDLDSTNGTSVNGVRLIPRTLEPVADGQLLTVARYSFQLLTSKSLRTMLLALRGEPTEPIEA